MSGVGRSPKRACLGFVQVTQTAGSKQQRKQQSVAAWFPPLPARAGGEGCPRTRASEFAGCKTPPVSWLGGLKRAAFPSGWPYTTRPGQWLARNWRRLTVARRRRLCTVFPNAEFAVDVV